jgi:hypothetical protein
MTELPNGALLALWIADTIRERENDKCGMWNSECGIEVKGLRASKLALTFRIPHSAFRIGVGQ